MKKRTINLVLVCILMFTNLFAIEAGGPNYYEGQGRIVVSSDGNFHDHDDWAASAATLMILAKAGLQDKLVVYTYSDHIWGSTDQGLNQMQESVINGGKKFGFNTDNFIEAVSQKEAAYNAIRDAINASTADDPLFIIAGGPMHVVGEGIHRANAAALQHVTLISHSNWNDRHADKPQRNTAKVDYEPEHSGHTWAELEADFGNSVNFNHIQDQNDYESATKGFATTKATPKWDNWYWMRDHVDERVRWVYDRGLSAVKRPDWSDAGMAFYLIKGYDDGGALDLQSYIGPDIISADNQEEEEEEEECTNCQGSAVTYGANYIVFEADATDSPLDRWVRRTPSDPNYIIGSTTLNPIGDDYLEYTGPRLKSPLVYKFTCPKTGAYQLTMRLMQNLLPGETPDSANDVFIRLEGNYTSASKYTKAQLSSDKKYFGHGKRGWGVGYKIEPSNHDFAWSVYNLIEGEEYTFVMTGRSKRTCIDYILFFERSLGLHIKFHDDLATFNDPKYRPSTTLSVNKNTPTTAESVEIYPNPATNILNIRLNNSEEITKVNIINSLGAVIHTSEYTNGKPLDISKLTQGIYFLNLIVNNTAVTKMFVKK